MEKIKVFTVTEVNFYIKQLIEKDLLLSYIYVKGEISNLKIHTSGHMYFTLKDKGSRIKCVMFRSNLSKVKFRPEEGIQVIIKGYFSIYERDGQYQLYAESITLEGTGELYKAFEQLKDKLQQEGLFDEKRKKPLPCYPQNVAIITSPTGAAVRDIISIGKRRNPNIGIFLYPVLVQGEKAPIEIVEGLNYLNRLNIVDVIIIGRGGGSIEELWAFNEEIVARAINNSQIPVVSAVGHETDYTIADFTADLRAATPSAAAELVFPDKQKLKTYLNKVNSQINLLTITYIQDKRAMLERLIGSYSFRSLEIKIANYRQTVETLTEKLNNNIEAYLKNHYERLNFNLEKLNILNPASYLLRGYSYIKIDKDGALVSSVKHISIGDEIRVFLRDGNILALVKSKCEGD
jgi:exodeoxyribonuclease VII large subunit